MDDNTSRTPYSKHCNAQQQGIGERGHLALGALEVVQPRRLRDAGVPAEAVVPGFERLHMGASSLW